MYLDKKKNTSNSLPDSGVYLFIYKLRQEAWITHRPSSTTSSRGKKTKISDTTNKNDNTKLY